MVRRVSDARARSIEITSLSTHQPPSPPPDASRRLSRSLRSFRSRRRRRVSDPVLDDADEYDDDDEYELDV